MDNLGNDSFKVHVIKGKVTEVNAPLLYFKLEENHRIYIDINKPVPEFPCENDEIEIINPQVLNRKKNIAILGPETKCNFPHIQTFDDTETLQLLNMLRENNIDEEEFIAMDSILQRLEQLSEHDALNKCIIALLKIAPSDIRSSVEAIEYKKSLRKVKIKLPSDLNYVNKTSELYTFINFDGICLHNIYPNQRLKDVTDSCAEYLFGILDVDPTTGNFTLSDKISKLPVKFCNTEKYIYYFKNSLVMVKKWIVITEVFQEKIATSLQYILINFEDIFMIKSLMFRSEEILFYPKNVLWEPEERKTIYLQTIKISEIIYGYNEGPECWIEAMISDTNDMTRSSRLVCVVLTDNHISILPFLLKNVIYKLFYVDAPQCLKIETYKELYRLRYVKEIYKISKDTIFQECDGTLKPQNNTTLHSFEEVDQFLRNSNQYKSLSFCLTILRKELKDNSNFASWTPQRHVNPLNFGIPGENSQMHLTFWNPESKAFLNLYMIDRQNHVTPIGLVDGMKVRINNVQVHKNKYLKTTVFTSFEVVEYCPKIMFSSVNLSFNDRSCWQWQKNSPQTLLGMFSFLPQKCIVHGSFLFQSITDLKIIPICNSCKKKSVPEMPCDSCNIIDRDLNIELSIYAADSINSTFYIFTENKHFFFQLLGLRNSVEIKHFSNAFFKTGPFDVNFFTIKDYGMCTKDNVTKHFLDKLVNTVKSAINFNLYCLIDAVCIKQREAESHRWKLVEFVFVTHPSN